MDLIGGGGGRGWAIALAAIFLFFIAIPVGLGLTQLIFLPLPADLPGKGKSYEPSRVAVLFVAFLFYGWMGLAAVAAYFVWWYVTEARKKALNPRPALPPAQPALPPASEEPVAPRNFSLGDLLAMVLAITCSPLAAALYWGGDLDRSALPVFIMSALIFPVLYFRGLSRVNGNRVPMGRVRSFFLFLYPYAIFGAMYLSFTLIVVGGLALLFPRPPSKPFLTAAQLLRLGAAFTTAAGGLALALSARAQARDQPRAIPRH